MSIFITIDYINIKQLIKSIRDKSNFSSYSLNIFNEL
jgi:hypothetical protein